MFLTELLRLFLFEYVSVKSIKTVFCFLIRNPEKSVAYFYCSSQSILYNNSMPQILK